MGRETLPRKVRIIPELIKLTNREGDTPDWGWLAGHFIMYIRSGAYYLCIASLEGGAVPEAGYLSGSGALFPPAALISKGNSALLPPVSYRISRGERRISAEIFCPGKIFKPGEALAEIAVFFAKGCFSLKDALRVLYKQGEIFKSADFLRPQADGGGKPGGPAVRNKAALPGGYESWYNHYTNINERLILADLDALGKTENLIKILYLDRQKPAVFQIDDGWEKAVGEWEPDPARFPSGLGALAEKIEQAGYIPGLWLAPFIVTRRSRIFREKPEWLLREKNPGLSREKAPKGSRTSGGEGPAGKLVPAGFNHLWDKLYYCLDLSRHDVLDYLKTLIDRAVDEWGFRYLKLDFLYAGLFSGDFAEGGSPYEHYHRAAAILTGRTKTASGRPVTCLGCGAPLGPSYRHFPLSRIGTDTREEWDWNLPRLLGHVGRPSAYLNLLDTIGRSYLDGAVYINDPDVIFLRSKNCGLSENEKELIALVNFLLGGQIMFSDDPLGLTEGDITLTRRIAALYDTLAGDEYGAARIDRDVFRLESRSAKIWGLINLRRRPYRPDKTKEPRLYAALAAENLLLDHRLKKNRENLTFAGPSITLGLET
jgi:alpha-galactosidase